MSLSRAIAWLALIAGWILIWLGHGALGCCLIAIFAGLQLLRSNSRVGDSSTESQRWTPPSPLGDDRPQEPFIRRVKIAPSDANRTVEATKPYEDEVEDPASDTDARWLKLVWASYGNASLHGQIALEDWHRHGLTWGAVCSFRDGQSGRLIASDGFEWISGLRQRGARRISVSMQSDVPNIAVVADWDLQIVNCHFADRIERWAIGHEISDAERSAEALDWDDRNILFPLWGHGGWIPSINTYWRISVDEIVEQQVEPNWLSERENVKKALRHRMSAPDKGHTNSGFFYRGGRLDDPVWSRFSVLPPDPALSIPHELLIDLMAEKAYWDNQFHPKNDNGIYVQLQGDEQALNEVETHRQHIHALIGRVQRLAGSEIRWKPRLNPRP